MQATVTNGQIVDEIKTGKSQAEIGRTLHVGIRRIRMLQRGEKPMGPIVPASTSTAPSVRTESADDLIREHDVPGRVLEFVSGMAFKQTAQDDALRLSFGIGRERWSQIARRAEFVPLRFMLPTKRIVWGSVKTVEYMKERLVWQ
jgi:hypothetical protein